MYIFLWYHYVYGIVFPIEFNNFITYKYIMNSETILIILGVVAILTYLIIQQQKTQALVQEKLAPTKVLADIPAQDAYQPIVTPLDESYIYYPDENTYLLPYDLLDLNLPYHRWMYYYYPNFYGSYYLNDWPFEYPYYYGGYGGYGDGGNYGGYYGGNRQYYQSGHRGHGHGVNRGYGNVGAGHGIHTGYGSHGVGGGHRSGGHGGISGGHGGGHGGISGGHGGGHGGISGGHGGGGHGHGGGGHGGGRSGGGGHGGGGHR